MKGPSPLLGYNTNVRHHGKLYHIQTEDSGVKHPHIITHLFADGGRVISSRKTSYAEHVGSDDCQQIVKKLMQAQHKAMFIALRDGEFDEEETPLPGEVDQTAPGTASAPAAAAPPATKTATPAPPTAASAVEPKVDVDALERAAARLSHEGPPPAPASQRPTGAGVYQSTRPARAIEQTRSEPAPESIFGKDLLSEKSLDEVILSYLAEDLDEPD